MNAYTGQVPDTRRAPDWRTSAACRAKGFDPDLMFPGDSEREIAHAKSVCARCPVWEACLDHALRTEDNQHGIRGALKPCERRALLKPDSAKPPAPKGARPPTLADAFRARTTRTTDGHLTWSGAVHIKFGGERYTAWQAAFIVGHGREPEGPVRRTCNVECFRSDHLTDAVIRDSAARCGTRPGYQRHRKNGEKACDACRQANTDADNRLRRTGTTKAVSR